MSWASHNPKLYDEIIRKGIQRYLEDALYRNGFTFPQNGGDDEMTALVEMLQQDPHFSKVYHHLMALAHAQICDAETNHFAGLADAARDRCKYKEGRMDELLFVCAGLFMAYVLWATR